MKNISQSILLAAVATGAAVSVDLMSAHSAQALSLNYDDNIATIDGTSFGKSFTIYSYGASVGTGSANIFTNDLNSEALFTVNSFSGNSASFTIKLTNNSGGDITASRLTVFGFDVEPISGSYTGASSPEALVVNGPNASLPQSGFLGFSTVDSCFKQGGNVQNCNNGNGGVPQAPLPVGNNMRTFTTTLAFTGNPASFDLKNFYFRYQGIDGSIGNTSFTDASAVGTPGEVPTPALLPGLLGMGIAAFRKKQGEAAAEEV